jgi:hypothetical protein
MLGLVLGGEGLLGGVRGLVGRKPGQQEVSWMTSEGSPETRRKVAQALAESILDRRAKVWVRVTLGENGEWTRTKNMVTKMEVRSLKSSNPFGHALSPTAACGCNSRKFGTSSGMRCHASRVDPGSLLPNISPLSRDEYPFASSMEGGAGSWVGHVPVSQQNAQGAILKNFYKLYNIQPGDVYRVVIVP